MIYKDLFLVIIENIDVNFSFIQSFSGWHVLCGIDKQEQPVRTFNKRGNTS
ncbi:hypothetical protein CFter6_2305 [Collimonas fungivorans]|uniref:Uncharacterized protein n=1 Tax=Collimonas fungivorans TaxID=158899 RepID=A0A127PB70_9BURK|nr:hypothetical protein CFter6_2305 [Collimonas fungivorans]